MTFWDIIKVFFPLILIIGLLYTLLHYIKKSGFSIGNKRGAGLSKNFQVKVINTQMIMPKKFISVVKIKDKFLVLGVSENSINMLKEFNDEYSNDEQPQPEAGGDNNFFALLKKNIGIR